MRISAQPAFVLHARAWRETSLIIELLSRDFGRIALVARGLRGAKKHPLRAALQPLQYIQVDFLQRGELGQLVQAEAVDAAPVVQGDALMAAFYINELLLRLLPRHDAVPEVFARYAQLRTELALTVSLAWTLRRFERDLLELLGVGFPWDCTEDGQRLDPAARYRLEPQQGPVRDHRNHAGGATGAALLALADDRLPSSELLAELRLALRAVLSAQFGGGALKSWSLMSDLARVRGAPLIRSRNR